MICKEENLALVCSVVIFYKRGMFTFYQGVSLLSDIFSPPTILIPQQVAVETLTSDNLTLLKQCPGHFS